MKVSDAQVAADLAFAENAVNDPHAWIASGAVSRLPDVLRDLIEARAALREQDDRGRVVTLDELAGLAETISDGIWAVASQGAQAVGQEALDALLANSARLTAELAEQWEAAHFERCGRLVDGKCPQEGKQGIHGCQWPRPRALAVPNE